LSTPKHHHFVPQWYLEQFVDDRGFLHVYDRVQDTWRRQRPAQVMAINFYYRQEWVPPGVDPNVFEKGLGGWFEAGAPDAFHRLISESYQLTDDDCSLIVSYLELQWLRVPRFEKSARGAVIAHLVQNAGHDVSIALQNRSIMLDFKKAFRLDMMSGLLGKLSPWFMRMNWEILCTLADSPFITTDSPVSFCNERIAPPAQAGIAYAGTRVFFPITKTHLLVLSHPEYAAKNCDPLMVIPEPVLKDCRMDLRYGRHLEPEHVTFRNWEMLQLSNGLAVASDKEGLQRPAA
jgi:hypothetical protein